MSDFVLTFYQEDDITAYFAVGTAAAHANPYLQTPEIYAEAEIDLLRGASRIGRIECRVIDPQSGATQVDRYLTALLGNADGYSELNGRRAVLAHDDGTIIIDGVCAGSSLSESFAGFRVAIEDVRARGIEVPLFNRSGTATVLPRGVLDGYGLLPTGEWLIPPTMPFTGTYVSAGILGNSGYVDLTGYWEADNVIPPELALTDTMRDAMQPGAGRMTAVFGEYTKLAFHWRPTAGGAWNVLERTAAGVDLLPVDTRRGRVGEADGPEGVGVTRIRITRRLLDATPLPDNGDPIEIVIAYAGPPSEAYPLHLEGTAGTILRNVLRGDYSADDEGAPIDPRLRYDEDAFVGASALPELQTPVRLRITEPHDDLREWFEDACAALGIAPALNELGEISPVGQRLPDESVTLAEINDTNSQPIPGWEHPTDRAVTQVEIVYPRDFRVDPEDDPAGDRSAGDGIASVEQRITVRPQDTDAASTIQDVMGVRPVTIVGFLFRALGGETGQPISGDVMDDTGAQIAYRRGHELIDRFAFGGQTGFVRCDRSDSDIDALRVGDWVIDARSWRPNYATGERGGNHLAQVVSIRDLNPAWREMRLVDAAPYANPVGQPTLGTVTADADGIVSVPVATIAAGSEARVDYAIAATVPATSSALWTYLGRTATVETLTSPPLPAGSTVWVRARGEQVGRRPSAWTTPVSIALEGTPRTLRARLHIDPDGIPSITWEANGSAAAVRIHYAAHFSAAAPALSATVDSATSPVVLPTLERGQYITAEVEPWTGWTGSAVSGDAGERVRVTGRYAFGLEPASLYGFTRFEEVPSPDPRYRRWEWEAGPRVTSVWAAIRTYDGPPSARLEEDIKQWVAPVTGLSGHFDVPKPAANKVVLLRAEPRYMRGGVPTVHPDHDVVEIRWLYPVPPAIHGWLNARYVAGSLNLYAGADPTTSALPVAWEIRDGTRDGSVRASGTFATLAAAQAGVGGSGALSGLTPPQEGKAVWWAKFADVADNVEWASTSVEDPTPPRLRSFRQRTGSTPLTTDLEVNVGSPLGRDVTLYAWVNRSSTDDPDPGQPADSFLEIPFTLGTPDGYTVTTADVFANGVRLFDEVAVFPGVGKTIHMEAVDELGISSGVQSYTIHSWSTLQRSDGSVIDDAVDRPAAFAASIRPLQSVATLPGSGDYVGHRVGARDTGLAWEWDGDDWVALESGVDGFYWMPYVVANSISTRELAAFAATLGKLNVASVFLSGFTLTDNSPGAGSIAWSAGSVIYEGAEYEVASGNTADPIVWWDRSDPGAFKTSTDTDDLAADGYDEKDGDAVVILNDDGTAQELWNGTLIYGPQIVTQGIKARHLEAELVLVDREIRSSNYDEGVAGFRFPSSGILEAVGALISGTVTSSAFVGGIINDLDTDPTTGIRLGGGITKPVTWEDYIDFAAKGTSELMVKLGKLEVTGDDESNFGGSVTIDTTGLGNALNFEHSGTPVATVSTTSGTIAIETEADGFGNFSGLELADTGVILRTGGTRDINILPAGYLVVTGLPTSDPGGSNRIWSDGGILKIT